LQGPRYAGLAGYTERRRAAVEETGSIPEKEKETTNV